MKYFKYLTAAFHDSLADFLCPGCVYVSHTGSIDFPAAFNGFLIISHLVAVDIPVAVGACFFNIPGPAVCARNSQLALRFFLFQSAHKLLPIDIAYFKEQGNRLHYSILLIALYEITACKVNHVCISGTVDIGLCAKYCHSLFHGCHYACNLSSISQHITYLYIIQDFCTGLTYHFLHYYFQYF